MKLDFSRGYAFMVLRSTIEKCYYQHIWASPLNPRDYLSAQLWMHKDITGTGAVVVGRVAAVFSSVGVLR